MNPPIPPEVLRELELLVTAFVFMMGACIGSFLNVVIWRLPRGESLSHPGSHCPKCNHPLAVWQNVPILGWLVLRGRCFYCKAPISVRYPVVELFTALLFTAVWAGIAHAGLPWASTVRYLFMAGVLLAAAVIDAEHGIIPDKLVVTGLLAALAIPAVLPGSIHFPGCAGHGAECLHDSIPLPAFSWLQPGTAGFALLTSLLGMAAGGAFMASARVLGTVFWGRRDVALPEAESAVSFGPGGLRIGGAASVALDELIGPRHEACELRMVRGQLEWRGEDGAVRNRDIRKTIVRLDDEGAEVGDLFVPASAILSLEGTASRAWRSREVLGLGDVKLTAMIGAFLGPLAVLCVILFSSLAAMVAGCLALPFRRGSGGSLPYGPYLSLAAICVFFFWNDLVLWIGHVILAAFMH